MHYIEVRKGNSFQVTRLLTWLDLDGFTQAPAPRREANHDGIRDGMLR